MKSYERWCKEQRFGIIIPLEQQECMRLECEKAKGNETGGILMGRYNAAHDCAVVAEILEAPDDSISERFKFFRGIKGLKEILRKRWMNEGTYYLGEWHFHPGGSPNPSVTDNLQMNDFARTRAHRCPEPILIILGGDPSGTWSIGAFVYTATEGPIELL